MQFSQIICRNRHNEDLITQKIMLPSRVNSITMETGLIYLITVFVCTLISIMLPSAIVTIGQNMLNIRVFDRKVEPWLYYVRKSRSRCCCRQNSYQQVTKLLNIAAYERLPMENVLEIGLIWCTGRVDTWAGANSKLIVDSTVPISAIPEILDWLNMAATQEDMPEWFRTITKWKLKISNGAASITMYYDDVSDEGATRLLTPAFDPIWNMLSLY